MGVDFIEFPKLGIRLNISPVAFSIPGFNIEVRWYGIIIATAIMVALMLALKQSKKFDIKEDDLIDMFLIALPVSIIFARLFFVAFTWRNFKNDLLGIFRIWEGGLAIYGAIIGAVISVYFFTRKRKMEMLHLCDFACVYLPLAQAIGRWGNFTNQELYGSNTDLPWGMTGNRIQAFPDPGVDGTRPVHPTFLYESLLNIIVFIVLLRLRKRNKVKGSVFASYLMMYSFVRFLMEFLRADVFGVGSIRYNQVFAALVFIAAFIWLIWLIKRPTKLADITEEEVSPSAYSNILEEIKSSGESEAEINGEKQEEQVSEPQGSEAEVTADHNEQETLAED
ncbi:MAG: prolipoprotein diacylglyceryl transferase [Clostridiaceae bacterium]|nr:prolipoprotein diacylglyceryl transferase [Clostridiaceae bacterium]